VHLIFDDLSATMTAPPAKRIRPRCPFYGFHWPAPGSNLIDVGNNECGLDFDAHGPCAMETEGRLVDFGECPKSTASKNLLSTGAPYIRFYPAELSPTPITFDAWHNVVMQAHSRQAGR
jgi:hypothetical protein